jgi:hypothetical protein
MTPKANTMNRRHHFAAGIVFSMIVHIAISIYHFGQPFPNPNFAAFFGGAVGALFPDWDFFIFGRERHRNSFFHSSMLQVGVFAFYLFDGSYVWATYFLLYFNLGTGIHLLLDLLPTSIPDEYRDSFWKRWEFRWMRFKQGRVGGKIVGPPFGVTHRRRWLAINGLICILLAIANYLILLTGFVIIV